jgi:hypothetical protein
MFTTNSGTVVDGRISPHIADGFNLKGTPEYASQDGELSRKVNPGEKIIYLYRCVIQPFLVPYTIYNWIELRRGSPSTRMLRNAQRFLGYRSALFKGLNTLGTLYFVS